MLRLFYVRREGQVMRILLVGSEGMLGRALRAELGSRHEVVGAGRTRGDLRVDVTDTSSIAAMYAKLGQVDAVVCAAGEAHFGPLGEASREDFMVGVRSKLMGQIDLVLQGLPQVRDQGSFTLISGITERDPVRGFVNSSMVNAALGGFVLGAAIEMPRGLRINVVSPGLFAEAADLYPGVFPGHVPVPLATVSKAFAKSVEGGITGKVICP